MNSLTIRNIGPIENVTLLLNKVNVIMGPQSSGKSTIAKIISYCHWVEKHYILEHSLDSMSEQLKEFHRMNDSYFNDDSYFKYIGDVLTIICKNQRVQLTDIKEEIVFENNKNIYIPAERNLVFVVQNLGKYKRTNDNIMNFIYDWNEVRQKYKKDNKYPILGLDVSYYYDEDKGSDILVLEKSQKELLLNYASSGLQSVVPMLVVFDYLTDALYREKSSPSIDEKKQIADSLYKYYSLLKEKKDNDSTIENSGDLLQLFQKQTEYHFSRFIIEEPEQNLFPETQRDLMYYILQKINDKERNHQLTLTTHSPYILYALNNCMMGYVVKDIMPFEKQKGLKCMDAYIDPSLVSIWEIVDGNIRSIQEEDGLIGNNYFDSTMKSVMDDFYAMINYYGNEE